MFARAAGIPQYEVEPNETEIQREAINKPKSSEGHHPQGSETQAKAHGSGDGQIGSEGPAEEPGSESSHAGANNGGGKHDGGGPSGGESSNVGGAQSGDGATSEGKIGSAEKVATGSEAQGKPVSSSTAGSGGGSSPVVPILIAVVVLAAISIGVVIYRQRKGGSGQDGRVSSPNAS